MKISKVGLISFIIILQLLSPVILMVGTIAGSMFLYGIITHEVSPNLYIDIPYTDDKLLVKESGNAFRSWASIYYVNSIGLKTYMGKTTSYGGVTPFKDGDYSVTYGSYGVSVEWEHRFEWEWWEEKFFYYPIFYHLIPKIKE